MIIDQFYKYMSRKIDYYIVKDNKVIVEGTEIAFEYPIQQSIEMNDMLIVYIDLHDKVIPLEENVFGISLPEKKIAWQIEKRDYPVGNPFLGPKMICSFTSIVIYEGRLRLNNWCSTYLIVEPTTGKVLEEGFSK